MPCRAGLRAGSKTIQLGRLLRGILLEEEEEGEQPKEGDGDGDGDGAAAAAEDEDSMSIFYKRRIKKYDLSQCFRLICRFMLFSVWPLQVVVSSATERLHPLCPVAEYT